jgi:hypothetical protein
MNLALDLSVSSLVVPEIDTEVQEDNGIGPSGPRIRCPRCGWSPGKGDLWSCTCSHAWNTFDTGGVCPACLHQREWTQCLMCHELSAPL